MVRTRQDETPCRLVICNAIIQHSYIHVAYQLCQTLSHCYHADQHTIADISYHQVFTCIRRADGKINIFTMGTTKT